MAMGRIYKPSTQRGLNFKQVKTVQKLINKNQQMKVVRQAVSSTMNTTGVLTEISTCAEGDNFNNRDGDKIKCQSIKCVLTITPNASSATSQVVRILVARGKNGPLAIGAFPATVNAQPDLDQMQVYHDRIYSVVKDQDGINFDVPIYKSFKNKKVPHLLIHYSDAVSSTLANDNPLYLFVLGNNATNPPTCAGYTDMKFFNAN